MSTFLLLLLGFISALFFVFVAKYAKKWYHWALSVILCLWVGMGASFVYINLIGTHTTAAAVGVAFFGIVAVLLVIVLARMLGLIGSKKDKTDKEAA